MNNQFKIHNGDRLNILKTFEDNSIDNICTDPPYGYNFMGKNKLKKRGFSLVETIFASAIIIFILGAFTVIYANFSKFYIENPFKKLPRS